MKIIVPMAGRGSRLRPHTLTVPKPLVPVAGKPIVHRLVEDIANVCQQKIDEIAFVIGDFGKEVEQQLIEVAASLGARGRIFYQEQALGTAHAVLCAEELLEGEVVVAFADTLFKADFNLDTDGDGILWVKQIEDPSAFGVVTQNEEGVINGFVEKPKEFVSDLAMIGIYFFKKAEELKEELQYLVDQNIIKGGEYQLPDALRNMTEKGRKFYPGKVDAWLDCGNKKVTVETNKAVLEFDKDQKLVSDQAEIENSVIIPPSRVADDVVIKNSVIGPHVTVGKGTKIVDSRIENGIIQHDCQIECSQLKGAMIGSNAKVKGHMNDLSISDYSEVSL